LQLLEKQKVNSDLAMFNGAMENKAVNDFLCDPFIPAEKKLGVLTDISAKKKVSPLVINLFGLLAENNRMDQLASIATIFGRICQAEEGFTPVTVTSATELSGAQKKEVAAAVEAIVGAGGKVEINSAIDADIVGGLVVSIGDKYTEMNHIDLSTSTKVKKYSAILKSGF
jgi:ATP synthase F1 delta subunit